MEYFGKAIATSATMAALAYSLTAYPKEIGTISLATILINLVIWGQ